MTLVSGAATIANDAISSAKLADQSAINVASNGVVVFQDASGNQQWKLDIGSNKFQISYHDGSSWATKFDIAN